jgi:hypothetical protein
MSLTHSPNIVTDSLLLNLDFKNPKKFTSTLGTGNLVQNPNYNSSTWSNIFSANATLTTGIDAPDGSMTAVRMSCRTSGQSLLRISFTSFTPNTTDTYIISFYVRKISGTILDSNQIWSGLHDVTPSLEYSSQLVTGKWVRISYSNTTTATAKTFFDILDNNTTDYVLDFWGVKVENDTTNAPMPFKDTVGGYTMNLYRNQFATVNDDSITFTRSASTPKYGPNMYLTATGNLTVANFMYNNHTWEVWFKINDINPAAYDATEQMSNIIGYRGYHTSFEYTSTTLYYYVWNGLSTLPACASWTIATSGAQINQGSWYQVVVVRTGDVFTPYVNGAPLGTGSTTATAVTGIGTTNDISIGGFGNNGSGGGSYNYYPKCSIANSKMYNRALTAAEVLQNFNALRGRFGI